VKITPTRRNLAANFIGSFWTSALGLAFVPIYIRYLGVEVYGLIGAFAIIQSLSSLLDAGLGITLNRELAHASGRKGAATGMRDFVFSLQCIYWALAFAIGIAGIALAPILANHWLKPTAITSSEVTRAFVLMAVNFAFVWAGTLYTSGLQGLQRHVSLNGLLLAMGTLRAVGAVSVLVFVSPTLSAFFLWQIVVSAVHAAILHWMMWHSLPDEGRVRARFAPAELRRVWRFAAGMTSVTFLTILLTQADKIVLSRVLTLEQFGYYALAGAVALTLGRLTSPLYSALFPRFAQLVGAGAENELTTTYHRACRLASVLVIPSCLTIAMFAHELLWAWTADRQIVQATRVLLSILILGTGLNGLMVLPFAVQAAHGWTRLIVTTQAAAVLVLVPAVLFSALRWGAVGGAMGWLALNLGYVLFVPIAMHRRILRGALANWYLQDIGRPLAAALAVLLLLRWLVPGVTTRLGGGLLVATALLLSFAAAAAVSGVLAELVFRSRRGERDVAAVASP
jgi:O-antigen/teichoic acid export membrane protein